MSLPPVLVQKRRRTAIAAVLGVLIVAVIFWVGRDGGSLEGLPEDEPEIGWARVDGEVRPDLLTGRKVVNGDVPAELPRVVLVNLWASYCQPCRDEMPALDELDADDELGVAVVGISLDKDMKWAREFQQDVAVTFPNVLDHASELQEELSAITPVQWMPTTFLVIDGRAEWVHLGPFDDLGELRSAVSKRISSSSARG